MSYPSVSIIILNWNGLKDTIECLESLKKITYPNYKVIVVDNGSKNDEGKILKERFGDYIYLIQNKENLGFAEGNNVGIKSALKNGADYVLLLNNDTVVKLDFLDFLVNAAINNKNAGVIGAKTLFYSQPNKIAFGGGKFSLNTVRANHLYFGQDKNKITKEPFFVDFAEGSCVLIKKDVFERVGSLNSNYFSYWEDVDFCLRAQKYFEIILIPSAVIWHKISKSTKGDKNPFSLYYMSRNRWLIAKKHLTLPNKILFLCYFPIDLLYNLLIIKQWNARKALARGTRDGFMLFLK